MDFGLRCSAYGDCKRKKTALLPGGDATEYGLLALGRSTHALVSPVAFVCACRWHTMFVGQLRSTLAFVWVSEICSGGVRSHTRT